MQFLSCDALCDALCFVPFGCLREVLLVPLFFEFVFLYTIEQLMGQLAAFLGRDADLFFAFVSGFRDCYFCTLLPLLRGRFFYCLMFVICILSKIYPSLYLSVALSIYLHFKEN